MAFIKKGRRLHTCLASLLMLSLSGCGKTLTDSEYLARAKDFQDKGQLNASIIELKNALSANPANVEARWLLGNIYLQTGQGADAEKELKRSGELGMAPAALVVPTIKALLLQGKFQEVLDFKSDITALDTAAQAKYWAQRGHAYRGLRQRDEAAKAYAKALSLDPQEAEGYVGQALLAITDRKPDQDGARQLLDKALALDPTFVGAWSLAGDLARQAGDTDKAVADYDRALALPGWNLDVRLKRALTRILQRKYDQAQKDVAFIRSKVNQSPGADYAEGLIHLEQGDYADAQSAFEAALAINSGYSPVVFYLGVVHALQGHDQQAEVYLSQYANKYPGAIRPRQLLAVLALRNKHYDEARQRLLPVLQQHPDNLLTLKLMANVAMKQGDTGEAINYMRKVVAKEPGIAESHLRLGLGLLVQGEREPGVQELRQAINLESDDKIVDFVLVLSDLRDGKLDEGMSSARAYTSKYPDSPMGWNLQGLLQIKQKQVDAARHSFEKALEVEPGEPGAANNLALLALKDGDVDGAIRLYQSVLEKRPEHMPTVEKLVKLLLSQGREADARRLVEQTRTANPGALEPRVLLANLYRSQGEARKAVAVLMEVQDKYSDDPLYLDSLGCAQMEAGDLTSAVRNLERLVQRAPNSALAFQLLSQGYDTLGDRDAEEKALNRALQLDPKHFPSWLRKLKLEIEQGRLDEATQLLGALQKAYPDNPQLQFEQARLQQAQGKPEEAVRVYQELVKRLPNADLVGQLALAQWQAGEREAAIKTLQDWLQDHPKDQMVRYNLANLYLAAGRNDAAREAFSRVVEANPTHPVALANLALLSRKTDPDKALAYAKAAHNLAPDTPVAQDVLAQLLLDRGEAREAAGLLQQAVKNAPNDPQIRYHWALALSRSGEKDHAIDELRALLERGKPFNGEQEVRALLEALTGGQG